MPDKRIPLVNGEFYHIFNRGIAHQPTFLSKRDYTQILFDLSYYRFHRVPVRLSHLKKMTIEQQEILLSQLHEKGEVQVKIVSFVLMPNHFHFLLQQTIENGISHFISKLTNSYTKYFNKRQDRAGPIFQGLFKAVHIDSEEQLLHTSRYIHLNPIVGNVIKTAELANYPYSSLPDFINGKSSLVSLDSILNHFSSPKGYLQFVLDQIDYAKTLHQIKHIILE